MGPTVFLTLTEAKILIEGWRREYNQIRPHRAPGYRPPARQALKEAGIETVDAMPVILETRAVKTEDEIHCLMRAVSIAGVGW